jgi:hypothetical protein
MNYGNQLKKKSPTIAGDFLLYKITFYMVYILVLNSKHLRYQVFIKRHISIAPLGVNSTTLFPTV